MARRYFLPDIAGCITVAHSARCTTRDAPTARVSAHRSWHSKAGMASGVRHAMGITNSARGAVASLGGRD
jgi:hypothetical protein